MRSNLLNVSLVPLSDSFDALIAFVIFIQSIGEVKGGMSLRNGMWHGLRTDIVMWNVI